MPKMIINISDEIYDYIQSDKYDKRLEARFDYQIRFAVKEGTVLSDNATNRIFCKGEN